MITPTCSRYDYLPYFYSRVFEYEGSTRKVWWQFYGDNGSILQRKQIFFLFHSLVFHFLKQTHHHVFLLHAVGDTIEVGKFDPKIATFWIDSGNYLSNSSATLCCITFLLIHQVLKHADSRLKGIFLESGNPEVVSNSFFGIIL